MNNVELINAIKEILDNTPEINLNNFDIDQVEKQNNALIEINQLLMLHNDQLNEETRKDFDNENCELNIPFKVCGYRLNDDCRGCKNYK